MVKNFLSFLVERFVRFYLQKFPIIKLPNPTKLENIQNIIIFSNTALGDTLMSTPAIVQTRKAFPNAKITLFIAKNIYPLFKEYEYVDDFLLYDKGYKGFIGNILKMRQQKPDLILMFHSNGPQDIPTALLSGAKYILKSSRKNEKEKMLSTKLPDRTQHFIWHRLATLSYVTLQDYKEFAMRLPEKYHLITEKGRGKIGFQMRTSIPIKEWGVENFASLAMMILQHCPNIEIFLTGTSFEKKYCDKLYTLIPKDKHTNIHNHCGKYTLEELPIFLKGLDCLITGDTGPMHLAGALQIPSIALFLGGVHPKDSGLLQDKEIHKELVQESPITPNQVFEVWKEMQSKTFSNL